MPTKAAETSISAMISDGRLCRGPTSYWAVADKGMCGMVKAEMSDVAANDFSDRCGFIGDSRWSSGLGIWINRISQSHGF